MRPPNVITAKIAKITKNIITGICKLWEIMFNPEVIISLPGTAVI
jgi:hypothetical protein